MNEMNNEKPKWSYYIKVLTTYFPYIIVIGVFQFIGYKLLGISTDDIEKTTVLSLHQHLVIMTSMAIGSIFFLYLIIEKVDKESFRAIGLNTTNGIKEFIIGTGIGAGILCIGTFIMMQMNIISIKPIQFDFIFLGKSFLLFVMIAISEEFFFRGYVLRLYLKAENNKHSALVFSALLFGMSHSMNPNITNFGIAQIVVAGLLLGVNYMYTQRIWFGLGLHISWNFVQAAVFGYSVSGIQLGNTSNITFISTNEYLNGGEFGFEGTIFALVLQIIFFVIMLYYYENHYTKSNEAS